MATQNNIGLTSAGIAAYDGAGVFTAALPGTYVNLPRSGSNFTIAPMSTAKWIVNQTVGAGTHTTITSAMAAASSGDTIYVSGGTYTENFTAKPGVVLTSFVGNNDTGSVIINGTITMTAAGFFTVSGIELQTNSAPIIVVSGSAASEFIADNCYLNCTNNVGLSFTSSSPSAVLNILNCQGDIGATGGLLTSTSAGICYINFCYISNSGLSTVSSTISNGVLYTQYSALLSPVTVNSSGSATISYTSLNCTSINTTALTVNSPALVACLTSHLGSGSAPALTVNGSCTCSSTFILSGNSTAINGSGALTYENLYFGSGNANITTTTQSGGTLVGSTFQSPTTGFIGEYLRAYQTGGAPPSGVATTLTALTLSPGVWNMDFNCNFTGTGAIGASIGISTINNSFSPTIIGDSQLNSSVGALNQSLTISNYRVVVTTTTIYYAVVLFTYVSGANVSGRISATRVG